MCRRANWIEGGRALDEAESSSEFFKGWAQALGRSADKRGEELGMREIRTLIVDDSSVMRKIVERSLRQAGLDPLVVYEAGSGTEGLDVLRAQSVDLILSDINMPSMDGLEFLRQIRAQNLAPGVPVVMITTESSEEHVKQAILSGAQGYIRKPFTAEQVKERVLPLLNLAAA
jgi:two-component system chemotaxis response regulator CheY